jgi:hypothetical protein
MFAGVARYPPTIVVSPLPTAAGYCVYWQLHRDSLMPDAPPFVEVSSVIAARSPAQRVNRGRRK